jgi:hypothetical protein
LPTPTATVTPSPSPGPPAWRVGLPWVWVQRGQ